MLLTLRKGIILNLKKSYETMPQKRSIIFTEICLFKLNGLLTVFKSESITTLAEKDAVTVVGEIRKKRLVAAFIRNDVTGKIYESSIFHLLNKTD